MPVKKIKKKSINDKFYTKIDVANLCYEKVKNYIHDSDLLIEPSAGSGSFFDLMRHPKIGYDIEPENAAIIKANYFEQTVPDNSIVIGNPPYGNRNLLTKEFIRHSFPAKCIAFILPAVFRKETLQNVFSSEWLLVEDLTLPKNSFLLENKDYHVPCVFQIWVKKDQYPMVNYNLRESKKLKQTTIDFTYDKDGEYFMFGASPSKIISKNEVNKNNRGYYFSANPDIIQKLLSINWTNHALSSVSGGVAWFSKQQIVDIYIKERDK